MDRRDFLKSGVLAALSGWRGSPPSPRRKMAAEPLPREPLSGTCNASGAATLAYRSPIAFWAHAYIAIQVSAGAPTYAVTQGGLPLAFGQGGQTVIGPLLLAPGERVAIVVTGATALATVSGQVIGWQALDPTELLPLLPIQPTAVSIAGPSTVAISNPNPSDLALNSFSFEVTLATGATSGDLYGAGIGGTQRFALYEIDFDIEGAAGTSPSIQLLTNPGGGLIFVCSAQILSSKRMRQYGATLPLGNNIRAQNNDSVSHNLRGTIIFKIV
jgi:hypothetical protein